MKKYIYIKTQFEALHYWPDAPIDIFFLRHPHRHIFHVRIDFEVSHLEREIEFFQVKRKVDHYIESNWKNTIIQSSCESLAFLLFLYIKNNLDLPVIKVEINEDNENGAYVVK